MPDLYDQLIDGYDEAEESHGFDGEPLPTGWYPLKVEQILDAYETEKGAVMVRVQAQVTAGPAEGQRCFYGFVLGPSKLNKNGAARSNEEILKANSNIQSQMTGLMKAMDVNTGQPAGEGYEKIVSFYNVASWPGHEFVGKIQYQPARGEYSPQNRLQAYYHVADEKKGLSWLRSQWAKNGSGESDAQTV